MADVSQIKLPNGSVYDLIDEKSGYITAEYIENKTDYEIPVSRVGEIEVGETAIGTDSTNFPTSKAVVDYVDERVVQEIEAIDIPTVPTKTSDLTNDSGYLTTSDIASVMTYKGTKANYAALPSTGNTTGDVWHLTDTGAEWAWDGSAWQELGTAIDLSNYATKATTLAGYGITDAKIQNGTITLGSNTITPLTSFTETDPTVPSWAKQSSKPSYGLTEISGTDDLRAIEALTGTSGLLKKTAANTWTLDTNTYLTSYTETDPVFTASAAAGITNTDISNWNGKVNNVKVDGVSVVTNGTAEIDLSNIKTFIVNISENNGTYTSDKTAKEICEAHNAGRVVILKPAGTGSYVLLSFVYTEGNYYQADFYASEASNKSFDLYQYMIVTNNNITAVDYSYYNTSVNNAYLTIQKNGTTVESFSANASSNVTANITVPTKVSDLTNDSGFLTLATLPIYNGGVQ